MPKNADNISYITVHANYVKQQYADDIMFQGWNVNTTANLSCWYLSWGTLYLNVAQTMNVCYLFCSMTNC